MHWRLQNDIWRNSFWQLCFTTSTAVYNYRERCTTLLVTTAREKKKENYEK